MIPLAGHTPPSVDRVLMLNRADVGGPHSSERGPRADAERYGPGWDPGKNVGAAAIASGQVSSPARVALACCVLVHPCLRESPRHLHIGPALYDASEVGLGLNNESRRNQIRLAPKISRVTRVEPRHFSRPRSSLAVRDYTLWQTTLPGVHRRAILSRGLALPLPQSC